MKFNEYLKSCRVKYNLTQESLVQELYNFDSSFEGLDIRTLSRWEGGITRPTAIKQVIIVQMFQKHSSHIFPCFHDIDTVEDELCRVGIQNLIGKSKEHIINFPTNVFKVDDINISHIRSHDDLDLILNMPKTLFDGITSDYFKITIEHLKKWSLFPGNLFVIAQNNSQFFGMFFSMRLKNDVFKKVLAFEVSVADITEDDFAGLNEEASLLPFSFFAYNDRVATLLFIRFYAHLIANQDTIIEVGSTPLLEGGKKILEKMKLQHVKDKTIESKTLSSYSAPLEDVLINEDVLKMIFGKQDCPQDNE